MSQPFRPSALQRRILASLLHLISTEAVRLRALGVTVAPTVTVSDIYTDLASDKGRPAPTHKVIADELGAVPGVEKVKPSIEITDAVWSMMGTLPPPRVAGEPAPPPPPPPSTLTHPRLPGESGTQLFHRLLNAHPDGLTARQMRVMSGVDLASVASTEKTARRVRFSQAEPRAATVYQPLRDPREPAVEVAPENPPAEHVWIVEPENADDARPDVAPPEPRVAPPEIAAQLDRVRAEGEPLVLCAARSTYIGMQLECRLHINHTGSHVDEVKDIAWDDADNLDREPCPPIKVYVATSLDHAHRAVAVHKALEHAGHIITYKWTDHGSVQGEGVARLREVAAAELQGVREADVLVAILPGGRGTHAEIGVAIGLGIPVVLLEQVGAYDAECTFYHAPGVRRWMWAEESVLPLQAMWAEHVWRASVGPGASKSVPHQMLLANNEIADLEHALDEVRATCVGAGIPSETTDEATGTSTWWPTAVLVRRLVEREAMHVDALEQAVDALEQARFDLSLARDTCISAGIPGECVDAEGNTLPWGVPALVRLLAEREAMHVDARTEAESAARTHLNEVERLKGRVADLEAALCDDIAVLAEALSFDGPAEQRTWGTLLVRALVQRAASTPDEVADLRRQLQASVQAELERSVRITELEQTADGLRATAQLARYILTYEVRPNIPIGAEANPLIKAATAAAEEEDRLVERVSELEHDSDAAHALLNDTFGRSLKKREDESALVGLARTAVEADVAVDARAAEQRAKLAAALGLQADPEWTWNHLLTEALAVRSERDATRGERHDFAKAVCAALGKEDRTVDDVGPDFARTLVLEWVAKDARAYSAASTDRWDNLEAFRGMVADVAAAIGLADHDRTANPFATRVVVLERLKEAINEALRLREDSAVAACEEVMAALRMRNTMRTTFSSMPPHERWDALMEEVSARRPVLDVIREARAAIIGLHAIKIGALDTALDLLGAA